MLDARSNTNSSSIPDPWEISNQELPVQATPSWQFPQELHPLISAGGNPNALSLPSPQYKPIDLLLLDWIKLRKGRANQLADKVREAIGLLYWMKTMAY